jgi:type VI secretion system protein ImpH
VVAAGREQNDRVEEAVTLAREQGQGAFRPIVAFLERQLPGAVRIGEEGPAADEPIRFRADTSLAFPTASISEITPRPGHTSIGEPTTRVEVVATFLGLVGSVSPLPSYFAEEILQTEADSPTARDLLDVFHHRVLSLLYRAVSRYSPAHEFSADASDRWSLRTLSLAGQDPSSSATTVPRWRLLRWAPLLAWNRCSTWQLEAALEDVLKGELDPGASVKIEQFVGTWVAIPEAEQITLGMQHSTLGKDMVLGTRIFDLSSKIRLAIGPLRHVTYRRFQDEARIKALIDSTLALFFKDPMEPELALNLAAGNSPAMRLVAGGGCRLGVDSFLGSPDGPAQSGEPAESAALAAS